MDVLGTSLLDIDAAPELLFELDHVQYPSGDAGIVKPGAAKTVAYYAILLKLHRRDNYFLLYQGEDLEETKTTFISFKPALSLLLSINDAVEITPVLLDVFLDPEPDETMVVKLMPEITKVLYLSFKNVSGKGRAQKCRSCEVDGNIEVDGSIDKVDGNNEVDDSSGCSVAFRLLCCFKSRSTIADNDIELGGNLWRQAFREQIKTMANPSAGEAAEEAAARLMNIDTSSLIEAVYRGYYTVAFQLLLLGSNPNQFQLPDGSTALHIAVKTGRKVMVKLLLAFNADPTMKNNDNKSPVDLANEQPVIRDYLTKATSYQAKTRDYFDSNPEVPSEKIQGTYLMSLDGGGIRGFNICQYLIALEDRMRELMPECCPIQSYFDYIAGTSAGAIAALILLYTNHTLKIGRCLVYDFAMEVIAKSLMEHERLMNEYLQGIFKEKAMTSLEGPPHAIITATLANQNPSKLYLMTSYERRIDQEEAEPNDRKVWEAARMSSAAPLFFPPVDGKFLDGGLMANNPTNAAIEEISLNEQNKEFGYVLSIGTGFFDNPKLEDYLDFFLWNFPVETICQPIYLIGAFNVLFKHWYKGVIESEKDAEAKCERIDCKYHRWSPPLSRNIGPACKEVEIIIDMMYHTQMHILQHPEEVDNIAKSILAKQL